MSWNRNYHECSGENCTECIQGNNAGEARPELTPDSTVNVDGKVYYMKDLPDLVKGMGYGRALSGEHAIIILQNHNHEIT